jgi:hypothetical protein
MYSNLLNILKGKRAAAYQAIDENVDHVKLN